MPEHIALTGLTPREAIADTLHRCLRGIDSNDRELFDSAFVQDESMLVRAGGIRLEGWTVISAFFERVFDVVTSHLTSGIRIEVEEGADTAFMTANSIAYHVRSEDALVMEDTSYTSACLYEIDLVKGGKDGLWKIRNWELKILWTTGDSKVLHG